MSRHLRGYEYDGTTFGMDVDSRRATIIEKKAQYLTLVRPGYAFPAKRLCIPWNQVASLMGEAAWLVTEKHSFEYVQFDDSYRYSVIYPETEVLK